MKPMWVTYRYAEIVLKMSPAEIQRLESIVVRAPNGISWRAYKVPKP